MFRRSANSVAARLACAAFLSTLAGGCAAGSGAGYASGPDTRQVRSSLVMPGLEATPLAAAPGAARAWEFSRNDHLLGGSATVNRPDVAGVSVIRRDRQWTVNGRPVESTFTSTTSTQWRTGP